MFDHNAVKQAAQQAAAQMPGGSPSIVEQLLAAKKESDRNNWSDKHKLLRSLLLKHPETFEIDSSGSHVIGITHKPSGFRMHIPRAMAPDQLGEKK